MISLIQEIVNRSNSALIAIYTKIQLHPVYACIAEVIFFILITLIIAYITICPCKQSNKKQHSSIPNSIPDQRKVTQVQSKYEHSIDNSQSSKFNSTYQSQSKFQCDKESEMAISLLQTQNTLLSQNLTDAELNAFRQNHHLHKTTLQKKILEKKYRSKIKNLTKCNKRLQLQLNKLRSRLSKLNTNRDINSLQKEKHDIIRNSLRKLTKKLNTNIDLNSNATSLINTLNEQLANLMDENLSLEKQLYETQQELRSLTLEQEEILNAQYEQVEAEHTINRKQSDEIAKLQVEIQKYQHEFAERRSMLPEIQEYQHTFSERERLKVEIQEYRHELAKRAKLQIEIQEYQHELAERENLQMEIEECKNELNAIRRTQTELKKHNDENVKPYRSSETYRQRSAATQRPEPYETNMMNKLRKQLEHLETKNKSLEEQLYDTKTELELTINEQKTLLHMQDQKLTEANKQNKQQIAKINKLQKQIEEYEDENTELSKSHEIYRKRSVQTDHLQQKSDNLISQLQTQEQCITQLEQDLNESMKWQKSIQHSTSFDPSKERHIPLTHPHESDKESQDNTPTTYKRPRPRPTSASQTGRTLLSHRTNSMSNFHFSETSEISEQITTIIKQLNKLLLLLGYDRIISIGNISEDCININNAISCIKNGLAQYIEHMRRLEASTNEQITKLTVQTELDNCLQTNPIHSIFITLNDLDQIFQTLLLDKNIPETLLPHCLRNAMLISCFSSMLTSSMQYVEQESLKHNMIDLLLTEADQDLPCHVSAASYSATIKQHILNIAQQSEQRC